MGVQPFPIVCLLLFSFALLNFGSLLDTFLVRTLTVPAIAMVTTEPTISPNMLAPH